MGTSRPLVDALVGASALTDALAAAREAFVIANPRSLARYIQAPDAIPKHDPFPLAPFPLAVAGVGGARVHSADGRVYLDCRGGPPAALPPRVCALFYFDLLDSGILIDKYGGVAFSPLLLPPERALIVQAVADFRTRRAPLDLGLPP